jgi:outer membrane protein assembly factor BamB
LAIRLINEYENVRNMIAIPEGVVFMDGSWLKFADAGRGDLQWTEELDGWVDSIVADENRVYVATKAGPAIEAYDLQTGTLTWKSEVMLPDHTGYYLRLQDKGLYAYELWGLTYIFDPQTGKLVDKLRISSIGAKPFSLLQLENKDWLQSDGKQIMLVREDEVIWRMGLDGPPQKFPQIYDDMLIIRFNDDKTGFGSLVGLDLKTGTLVWQRRSEFYSNSIIVDNLLYIISKEATILMIDPKNGRTVGFAELLPNSVDTFHPISAIAVNEKMLYVYFFDSQELIAFERIDN